MGLTSWGPPDANSTGFFGSVPKLLDRLSNHPRNAANPVSQVRLICRPGFGRV